MSSTTKNGVIELQQPVDYERSPVGEKADLDYELKPGTAQDDYDMRRLGKTQELSVHAHLLSSGCRDFAYEYSEPSTLCQSWA